MIGVKGIPVCWAKTIRLLIRDGFDATKLYNLQKNKKIFTKIFYLFYPKR